MRQFLVPDSVGGRIRLYSTLMVGVPLLFAAVVLIVFVRASILENVEKGLLEQAVSHKIVIEEWYQEQERNIQFLAELDVVRHGQVEKINPILEHFDKTHPDISAVVMAGADGKTVGASSTKIMVDVSDREYFIKARAGEAFVTNVLIGRTSGKPIIIFSHPVKRLDGSFGGVVFLASRLTAIDDLMNNLRFGETGETYLLNREGYMLTESRYQGELRRQGRIQTTAIMTIKNNSDVLRTGLIGKQPTKPYRDYRGVKVLGASQWTKDGTWLIVSEIGYSEAIGPLYPFLWTIIGGFFISIAILSPVFLRLARSITQPLARISEISLRMTRGEYDQTCFDVFPYSPPQEIDNLVEAFCAMQAKVDETVQELETSAVTDQLTGLPNRRFLMKEGARLVDIAIRAKQPCTLFMMDIDHFKNINDTYGHAVGDIVLKQIAQAFQDVIRSSDIVARYGGEEFAVVAPGSDLESSQVLAERLRQEVAAHIYNTDELPLACTISIGIAHYAWDIRFGVDAYEDMLARADKALYQAKDKGRNRVEINRESEG
ncbi:diguanylate cyclase [Pseudodesulfovibrio nedwellii]|uniref:diguanylate cyclase n=1 Tax=Pseudodesulfovibrio nedwellii TaxID=2973072 RepID=A0ABM8B1I5_9BACT|nr:MULTISPECIES: GGDEF domain-containing protein [Pseudodesulfovibrio]BDQ37613.1 diguanylate cyclase [Pseudodesulfovibrio nedwellii]